MDKAKIEKEIANIAAIFSFEDMILTEQDKNNMSLVLSGEATADEVVSRVVKDFMAEREK